MTSTMMVGFKIAFQLVSSPVIFVYVHVYVHMPIHVYKMLTGLNQAKACRLEIKLDDQGETLATAEGLD